MAIKYKGILNGNAIKLLAAVFMLADHFGHFFAPILEYNTVLALRCIGRLAMPLFAFMIAEGCRYTKNRKNYFALLFGMGVICAAAYYVALGEIYLSIMTTFSISVLLIYAYDGMVNAVNNKTGTFFTYFTCFVALVFGTIALEVLVNKLGVILCGRKGFFDYGVIGALLPLLAYVFKNRWLRLIPFALGLVVMSVINSFDAKTINLLKEAMPAYKTLISTYMTPAVMVGSIPIHWLSLGSLVFLVLYNGERGKLKLKYFFYLFYPLHLLLLQGIAMMVATFIYS